MEGEPHHDWLLGNGRRALHNWAGDYAHRVLAWSRGCGRVGYRVEVSADGTTWVPAVPERVAVTGDRQNFTGLGRYVRVSATDGRTPLGIQKLEVFGTR